MIRRAPVAIVGLLGIAGDEVFAGSKLFWPASVARGRW
jgi:hypothetical protein